MLLRSLEIHRKLARIIDVHPYLESELLPLLDILRDDVVMPRTLDETQAAILIQKIWRGKRVRMQVKRVHRATRYLEGGSIEGEGEYRGG